jgi:hypothetical protein
MFATVPRVNFFARIDLPTEEVRRRLQARTGYAAPRLMAEAFQASEKTLDTDCAESEAPTP